jgi:hypothetical protein
MEKWFAWVDKLTKQGRYIAGEPLLPGGKTISGSKKSVSDGPFTESKEVIGGFFTITAASLDEAVEIAKDCPDYELDGSVEVREIMKVDVPAN